jgi:hypothetical protein
MQNVQDKTVIFPFSSIILQKVQHIPGDAVRADNYPACFAT